MSRDETYNGWTNWETWNTALILNNEQELQNEALKQVRFYGEGRFQDFVNEVVIVPHNKTALAAADEWNSIPYNERPGEYDYEKADVEPFVIDRDKVNWVELFESFREALRESSDY